MRFRKQLHGTLWLIIFISTLLLFTSRIYGTDTNTIRLSSAEQKWIAQNKGKTFILGLDPAGGIESFGINGERVGYIYDFSKDLEKDLGIKIRVADELSWNEALEGIKSGKVDILLGANPSPERMIFMEFTKSMREVPYVIFTKKDSEIQNVGDINGRTIAFLKGDSVVDRLGKQYSRLKYKPFYFEKKEEGVASILDGSADALIVTGGEATYDYLHEYPTIKKVCNIESLRSSMTLATSRKNSILAGILDKYINYEDDTGRLQSMIKEALRKYIQQVIGLTKEELDWLKFDGKVVFGVTEDYLPFDYFKDGEYKGINGAICRELIDLLGLRPVYRYNSFSLLLNDLIKRDVDVLCVAKTKERESKMLFTIPYIDDRDRIYGKTGTPSVFDISGLKGKRVAVIDGFYQIDMLEKNNIGAVLVYFGDTEQCIKAVHNGTADYLIENQQVLNYYTNEMGFYDILEKGTTTADTRLYFGINKDKPQLASIINKTIPLLEIEQDIKKGLETVPRKKDMEQYKELILIIGGLLLVLGIIGLVLYYLFYQLLKERTEKELLIQKEEILYHDSLTGIYNRNYYNDRLRSVIDMMEFPQAVVVFDLNNLKEVNDNYGHDVGDKVLEEFSRKMRDQKEKRICVRLGGDEFVVFLFGRAALDAKKQAEEICGEEGTDHIVIWDGSEVAISCAKGYAVRENGETSLDDLFREADRNMYQDKNNRREGLKK